MNKQELSERDICSKFITPALERAGWDLHTQIREEVSFTKGRIIVRGKLVTWGQGKPAPKPSHLAASILEVEMEQDRLVAAHGWHVYGALRAACRAAFIARGERTYHLTFDKPDVISADLNKVTDQILEPDIWTGKWGTCGITAPKGSLSDSTLRVAHVGFASEKRPHPLRQVSSPVCKTRRYLPTLAVRAGANAWPPGHSDEYKQTSASGLATAINSSRPIGTRIMTQYVNGKPY